MPTFTHARTANTVRRPLVLAIAIAAAAALPAHAHPLAPALLDVQETAEGQALVTFKTSRLRVSGSRVEPRLPDACRAVGPAKRSQDETSLTERFLADCGPGGIVGKRFGVDGLAEAKIDALLRLTLADGRRIRTVLRASAPDFVVPERERALDVARAYGLLGIEHILSGADHLLFVFGLLLLVGGAHVVLRLGGMPLLLKTVTAFTLGHSLTLSLAALGIASLPSRPIEVGIALSILALAVELAREQDAAVHPPTEAARRRPSAAARSWMQRSPWLMAGAFGLLHGMGFAGALSEIGLPESDIPLALFSFNVGIELGQIAFLAVVLAIGWLLERPLARLPRWTRWAPIYALGSLSAYWCIERSAALWP